MGFGLSGSETRTLMDGSDVTIAWIDNSLGPMAQDYHLRRNERTQVNIHTQFWEILCIQIVQEKGRYVGRSHLTCV